MRSKGKRVERRKAERNKRGGEPVPPPAKVQPMQVPPHIRELAERLKESASST